MSKELEAIVAFREYCEKQAAPFDVIATLEACRDEGVSVEIDPQKLIDLLISTQAGEGWRDIATAPVAFAVELPDGSISPMGWTDMGRFDQWSRMAQLCDGCRYVYAYGPLPSPPSDTKGVG
jgi:hypothetical protein